ncbi:hypothetical protein LPJ66_000102 [Kickxella alabastrina]|uniref:Uncharacterized protein n=1 Tax=Kickxella alabastrina TaxID=61397 RepID=A0ACC1IX17_9FUNG|nr:hypothetical protein LPJ66_000102 [Kickxella alabastrina]
MNSASNDSMPSSIMNKVETGDIGTGGGAGMGTPEYTSQDETLKRKHSDSSSSFSNEIDLSTLPPPRAGRPLRSSNQEPGMQEARKRARVLRNRAAAQLSREKKRVHVEQLEQENDELRARNEELEMRLRRTEDSNHELSDRLDGLAKQLQGFQDFLFSSQGQQQQQRGDGLVAPMAWSPITPLAASPMMQACVTPGANSSASSVLGYTSATTSTNSSNVTSTPSALDVSMNPLSAGLSAVSNSPSADVAPGSSLLSSIPCVTISSPPSNMDSTGSMELFSNTLATSDLSDKGLSESAALAQSGNAHIFCVHQPDSQQRRPLSHTQSICRKHPQTTSAPFSEEMAMDLGTATVLETCSLTDSSLSLAHRMVTVVVMAVVSASPLSSLRDLWMTFSVLWWVLSQNGGLISRHQVSRIARGILDYNSNSNSTPRTDGMKNSFNVAGGTAAGGKLSAVMMGAAGSQAPGVNNGDGMASLRLVAAWLGSGSRTAAAFRRVVGDGPVDQVSALVAQLLVAARSMEGRASHVYADNLACNKKNTLFYAPY